MEQIVKREKKSFIRVFLVFIGLVLLVDLTITVLNRFTHKLPYVTTIVTIGLVTLACGFLLIRYFSKLSYLIIGDYLVFSRIIGKREFEILRVGLDELYFVGKEGEDKEYKKPLFNFTLNSTNTYVGKYRRDGKEISFLFAPNKDFLRELNKHIK